MLRKPGYVMPEMKKTAIYGEEGIALLGVLAALFILMLISSGMLAVFASSGIWIKQARNETIASNYAAAILEELRVKRDKLCPTTGSSPEELDLAQAYRPDLPQSIKAQLKIELLDGFTDLYKIRVLLTWTENERLVKLNLITVLRKSQEVSDYE